MSRRSESFSIPRVWQYIGLGVVAAVVLTLVAAALQPRVVPTSERVAWDSDTFANAQAQVDGDTPLALFIGDSYAHGTGASSKNTRWSTLVASAKGWGEINEALGGTGFATTSSVNGCGRDYCATYGEVLQSLDVTAPAVIVIAGGQNDFRTFAADPATVTAAIQSTYETARSRFPSARIIAVGPSFIGDVSETVTNFDAAVQVSAASVGAEYISLINPDVIDRSMDSGDGGHVNDAGHRAIADKVLSAIG